MQTLRIKIANYLSEGILVWIVDPNEKRVEVYRQGRQVQIQTTQVTGEDVLPGFTLNVKEIFPEE